MIPLADTLPEFLIQRLPRFGDREQSLEREATRFAAHMWALALREGNGKGRLGKILRVAERADRRAIRRYKASL